MTRYALAFAMVVSFISLGGVFSQEPTQPTQRFKAWDRNHDGKLSRDEVPEEARRFFDQIDSNHDGNVSPEEDARVGQASRQSARLPSSVRTEFDIPYADTDNPRQRLDLYLPKTSPDGKKLPLVVFIHGGAFRMGDKRPGTGAGSPTGLGLVVSLVESGQYAGASIGYRLSGEAIWPAQIHDCKAAIRWLRANAGKYHFDPERIGVMGVSAGGHLVAMLGTSGGVEALEGKLGSHLETSSQVTCVVDEFGPTDLLALYGGNSMAADTPEAQLIGGALGAKPDAARSASPITFVSSDDPPVLIIHGTKDATVSFNQSERFYDALKKSGVDAKFIHVVGAGHGNFAGPEVPERIRRFFDKHLRGQDVIVSDEPIQAAR